MGYISLILCFLTGYVMIFTCSCQNENSSYFYSEQNAKVFQDSLSMEEVGTVSFPLDSITGFYHNSIQALSIADSSYMSFFNEEANSLYIYNYYTRKLVKRIIYATEGPDGLGNNYKIGHYIINLDSILICTPHTFNLFMTNGKGKVLKRYKIREKESDENLAYPDPSAVKPMTVKGGKAYIAGLMLGIEPVVAQTKVFNVAEVDLVSGSVRPLVPRPEIYNEGQWGMVSNYHVYPCYNPLAGHFIYSFGLIHEVLETDHAEFENWKYNASSYFSAIKPFSTEAITTENYPGKAPLQKYDHTTPSYYCIFFDEYRKVYYRFATLPLSEDEYNTANRRHQPTIIILNEEFEKIGETVMPASGFN
jgi:uncharacterized protein DUF4221